MEMKLSQEKLLYIRQLVVMEYFFCLFHDAGYRGIYNQRVKKIKEKKGIKPFVNHFGFMGRTELVANLFGIAFTEERLKNSSSSSEKVAMNIHKQVGGQVRKMIKDNSLKNNF